MYNNRDKKGVVYMESFSQNDKFKLMTQLVSTMSRGALEYQHDIDTYGYNDTILEFTTKNGQKNYEMLKGLIEKTKVKVSKEYESPTLLGNLKQYITIALTNIYGSSIISDLKYYKRLIKPEIYPDILDVTAECDTDYKKGVKAIQKVVISQNIDEIQTAPLCFTFINEYMRPYTKEKLEYTYGSIYYTRLPGLLTEQLALLELEQELYDKSLLEKVQKIRIKTFQGIEGINTLFNEKSNKLYNDICSELLKELHGNRPLEEQIKYNIQALKKWEIYDKYSYFIGDVYATRLLELYKDNKEEMKNYLREILNGQRTLLDLLINYQVSLTNDETIDAYKKKLERISN